MNTEVCGVSGGKLTQLFSHRSFTLSPSALNEDKRTDWIYSLFQLSASSHITFLLLDTSVGHVDALSSLIISSVKSVQ